jgi:catechol 2,3-dioxygenase-like lactoylglutathione lyase family enzyme
MHLARNLNTIFILLLLSFLSFAARAQAVAAPASEENRIVVDRPGHLGRECGDIEQIIHFYHDLLGLDLRGERQMDRPFWTSKPLIEFADAPPEAEFRAVIMPIPGTTDAPGAGREMTIEAIEYRNIERRPYAFRLQDHGVSWLRLFLRELDPVLGKLREEGFKIVTQGGAPVSLGHGFGQETPARAIVIRDPDGYPVELVERATGPGEGNVAGAEVVVVVTDLEASLAFYSGLIGKDLAAETGPTFITDLDLNRLRDTPGARVRTARIPVPGSPVMMEFIQYDNIGQEAIRPEFWDLGVGHMLFMVNDLDAVMSRIRAADLKILARSGEPVHLNEQVRALFTRDPDGFFVEFMERREAPQAAE